MTIEQLRELLERLAADKTSVTSEELVAAQAFIRDQRTHLAQADLSDDVVPALTELRDSRNAIKAVVDERASAAAELDEQRRGLLDELADPAETTTEQPVVEGGDTPLGEGAGPATDVVPVQPTSTAPVETAPVAVEPQAVAASGTQPRRAPIGAFKVDAPRPPQDPAQVVQTAVVAAGSTSGYQDGVALCSTADLAKHFADRLRSMATGTAGGSGEKVYVANVTHTYPESRFLKLSDWAGNYTKIEQATSPQALVAAGGLCAPLQVLYDVEVIGSSDRPIRDALARFGVERGGIQFRPHSSAASALQGGTGVGVDRWSMAQDAAAGPTEEKGCYVVDCPAIQEAVVHAVYLCLEFGNITARFDPETTAAHVREGMIAHARKAENELLRLLQAGSKALSAARVIGAVRDILANIDKATAYYRNRHRLNEAVSLTCILPAWVRYMMRTDLARQMAAGDWMEALGLSDAQITRWFRERGVTPVWHLDGGVGGVQEVQTVTVTGTPTGGSYTLTFDGQTTAAIAFNATAAAVKAALEALSNVPVGSITAAGGPHPGTAITVAFGGRFELTNVPEMTATGSFTGGTTPAVAVTTTTAMSATTTVNGISIANQIYAEAAAGAAIPGYPDQIDALLFASGTKLFLDGGQLDLGLVRDSTLNARNRYRQFSETFEGVADRGIENLRLIMTCQPTGQTSGTADLSAIAD